MTLACAPPPGPPRPLLVVRLAAGSVLWRVHSAEFAVDAFNTTDPDSDCAGGGGRFDSPGGVPPYLYAAATEDAAIAEVLLRDVPLSDHGYRELPRTELAGRVLSTVEMTRPIKVVALHGKGLHAVGQSDNWLASCGPAEYPGTRAWAQALMAWSPGAAGLVWRARHFDDEFAYVLYENRATGALRVVNSLAADTGEGLARVRAALRRLAVAAPE